MFGLIRAAGRGPAMTVRPPTFYPGSDVQAHSSFPPSSVVNNNPSAFAEAYWEINSLRVYTPGQQN